MGLSRLGVAGPLQAARTSNTMIDLFKLISSGLEIILLHRAG